MIFSFFLYLIYSLSEDPFLNKNPCDCDITDLCDPYCYCDPNCNSTQKDSFLFHIPESIISTKRISCDSNGYIKSSQDIYKNSKIEQIYGQNCYSLDIDITDNDKIISYTENDLSITSYSDISQVYSSPSTPLTNSPYVFLNNSIFLIPFGFSSSLCNSYIPIYDNVPLQIKCFPRESLINSSLNYNIRPILPTFCDGNYANFGCSRLIGYNYNKNISGYFLSSNPIVNQFSFTQNDITIVNTNGNGYFSGLYLTTLSEVGSTKYLTFNGYKIPFGSNMEFIINSNNQNFNYNKLLISYGLFSNDIITLDLPNISNITIPSKIILTLAYKKFGYITKPLNLFVSINTDIYNHNKDYSILEIKQIELNENGNSIIPYRISNQYSASISMIFNFMFENTEDTTKTVGLLIIFSFLIIVWILRNF